MAPGGSTSEDAAHAEGTQPTGARCATVVPARPIVFAGLEFELSVHRPSGLLLRDIELVFRPGLDAACAAAGADYASKDAFLRARLLVVPLWQPAQQNLSVVRASVSVERRQLCANFARFAAALGAQLGGEWLDASDPRSGQAMFGAATTATYNELDGLTQCLKYSFEPFGCCGIVLHPRWGYNAYPVSMFTTAPLDALVAALDATAALSEDEVARIAPVPADGAAIAGDDECA
ncbi:hypothetical protein KFE25_012426 [Diacronema lutheri]|uniref:Uncharacterized protein n=1 Tax=Diacronema lutheri TaxID=2081491 RepID=A0A8J5XDX4_DIALT|nr:hypothetical protein KFE25_012426 [Diacronema lutheri]